MVFGNGSHWSRCAKCARFHIYRTPTPQLYAKMSLTVEMYPVKRFDEVAVVGAARLRNSC
jgi:hypothetical protein